MRLSTPSTSTSMPWRVEPALAAISSKSIVASDSILSCSAAFAKWSATSPSVTANAPRPRPTSPPLSSDSPPVSLPTPPEAVELFFDRSPMAFPALPTMEPRPLPTVPTTRSAPPSTVSAGPAPAEAAKTPRMLAWPSSDIAANESMASDALSSRPAAPSSPFSMCGSKDSTNGPALSTTLERASAKWSYASVSRSFMSGCSMASERLENRPSTVFDCSSIMPPKSCSMPSVSALMAVSASTAPSETASMAPAVSVPIARARYSHAGMPASVSCSISSALAFPRVCIWPRARVTDSMPAWPVPSAAVASPTAVSIGMTSSAVKP